jgi:hypothetical protein
MGKPAVLRPLVREHRKAELFDAPETLKLGRVYQIDDEPVIRDGLVQRDDVV